MDGTMVWLSISAGLALWAFSGRLIEFLYFCASTFSRIANMGECCRSFGGQYANSGLANNPPKADVKPYADAEKQPVRSGLLHLAVDFQPLAKLGFYPRDFLDALFRALLSIGIEYKGKVYLEFQRDARVDLVLFIEYRSEAAESRGEPLKCELSYRLWNAEIPQEDTGIIELAAGKLPGWYDLNSMEGSKKLANDLAEVLAKHRPVERPKPYVLSKL